MAEVTICSDFGDPQNSYTYIHSLLNLLSISFPILTIGFWDTRLCYLRKIHKMHFAWYYMFSIPSMQDKEGSANEVSY